MRRLLSLAAADALIVAIGPAGVAQAAVTAPSLAIGSEFADPDISKFGGTYYAYSTNSGFGNVPVASATNVFGPYARSGDALPSLGAWARGGLSWAPDVSQRQRRRGDRGQLSQHGMGNLAPSRCGCHPQRGWNTLRLTHLTRWAEVDYIEVA